MIINYLNEWEDLDDMNIHTIDKTLDVNDENTFNTVIKDSLELIEIAGNEILNNTTFNALITNEIKIFIEDPNIKDRFPGYLPTPNPNSPKCLLHIINIDNNKFICELEYYITVTSDIINTYVNSDEHNVSPELAVMINLHEKTREIKEDINTTITNIYIDFLNNNNFSFKDNIALVKFLNSMKIEILKTKFMYYVMDSTTLHLNIEKYTNTKIVPIKNLILMDLAIPRQYSASKKFTLVYNPDKISNNINDVFNYLKVDINDYTDIKFLVRTGVVYKLNDIECEELEKWIEEGITALDVIPTKRSIQQDWDLLTTAVDDLYENDVVTGILKPKYVIHHIINNKLDCNDIKIISHFNKTRGEIMGVYGKPVLFQTINNNILPIKNLKNQSKSIVGLYYNPTDSPDNNRIAIGNILDDILGRDFRNWLNNIITDKGIQ